MSGASREHHKICKNLLRLLEDLLRNKGYEVYYGKYESQNPNEAQFYDPDIFITKEPETDSNRYVHLQRGLIIEVLIETTPN